MFICLLVICLRYIGRHPHTNFIRTAIGAPCQAAYRPRKCPQHHSPQLPLKPAKLTTPQLGQGTLLVGPTPTSPSRFDCSTSFWNLKLSWYQPAKKMLPDQSNQSKSKSNHVLELEVLNHFLSIEGQTSTRTRYMERQPHLKVRMRAMLVSWLVLIHYKLRLSPETLNLAINILDRYLSREVVAKCNLQLVGVTSMLIASKFVESGSPCGVALVVYLCDGAYNKNDVVAMELRILSTLNYQLFVPTTYSFHVIYAGICQSNTITDEVSRFILDCVLVSYQLLEFLPSQVACATLFIARKVTGNTHWTPGMADVTGYNEDELLPVARSILSSISLLTSDLESVYKKHGRLRLGKISTLLLAAWYDDLYNGYCRPKSF